jgi:hypothetical protein
MVEGVLWWDLEGEYVDRSHRGEDRSSMTKAFPTVLPIIPPIETRLRTCPDEYPLGWSERTESATSVANMPSFIYRKVKVERLTSY